ncbi:hypothetical protein ACH4FX_41380 [Streptomyces sp. NPDC018019]|uniref:hypothetical protein n=1 Tax=Streptomyces sp. NPDC018019 TaxID=3365030 RepID=UPI0037B3DCED
MDVTVCASDGGGPAGSGGSSGTDGAPAANIGDGGSAGGGGSAPPCTYTKPSPQPPAEHLAWEGKTAKDGALYQVNCPVSGRVGVVFVGNGDGAPAAPAIDPEQVARQAVDSTKLVGPDVASPRATGQYVVGIPVWMWVRQTTTYGPDTASATAAGGVTDTTTAEVASVA